eukprot:scaffold104159_cov15-Tisochrysis_lutea.AAC.1
MRNHLEGVTRTVLLACVSAPSRLAECVTACPTLEIIDVSRNYGTAFILVACAAALGQSKAIHIFLDNSRVSFWDIESPTQQTAVPP